VGFSTLSLLSQSSQSSTSIFSGFPVSKLNLIKSDICKSPTLLLSAHQCSFKDIVTTSSTCSTMGGSDSCLCSDALYLLVIDLQSKERALWTGCFVSCKNTMKILRFRMTARSFLDPVNKNS
jgi:hypothetical protein